MFCGVRSQNIPELVCTSREVTEILNFTKKATGAYNTAIGIPGVQKCCAQMHYFSDMLDPSQAKPKSIGVARVFPGGRLAYPEG